MCVLSVVSESTRVVNTIRSVAENNLLILSDYDCYHRYWLPDQHICAAVTTILVKQSNAAFWVMVIKTLGMYNPAEIENNIAICSPAIGTILTKESTAYMNYPDDI